MNELTAANGVVSLDAYEARIEMYKEQVVGGYLGIGRTLNEAKAAGVVPHGQWETWATQHADMPIRTVQRCMQAAREIADGTAMSRLDMSKAMALLSSGLEPEKQEAIAQAAVEESVPLRDVQRRIVEAKREVTQQSNRILAERLDAQEKKLRKEKIDAVNNATASLQERNRELAEQLKRAEDAQKNATSQPDPAQAQEIERLKMRLERSENARKTAQQELLTLQAEQAQDGSGVEVERRLTADAFSAAVRTFVSQAADVPYMGSTFAEMDLGERRQWEHYLNMMRKWCDAAQSAMQTVRGGVING